MKQNVLTATVNYGQVTKGHDYICLAEGMDYYLVKVRGKAMYIHKWVFTHDQ